MTMPDTRPIIVRGSDTRALKDYATEHVELAWISPFRKYAPAVLVLCVAALLAVAVLLPLWAMPECAPTLTAKLLLVLVYAALAALGGYLFITANALEQAHQRDVESTRELSGISERLDITLRSIGDGVISTDVDGKVTLMNDVAIDMTGWPADRAHATKASEVFHIINEKTHTLQPDPSRYVLSSGRRIREETQALLISRDGTEHPIAYNAAPILDSEGWLMGAVIVFHDVTELREVQRQREELIGELSQTNERLKEEIGKREAGRRAALSLMQDAQLAQAELRESEERLRVLFEGIDDALFVLDGAGTILDSNQAACTSLGYTRKELLGMTLREIEQADGASGPERLYQARDGRIIPVHVHVSNIRYRNQPAVLTVARDIAELRQIEDELRSSNEQLRESNAALEEYARVASHDLQEPLRKIESFVQVLIEDYADRFDPKGRNYLDIMVDAARRMRRLIRDVLAFSRAGTAEQPLAPVDLDSVAKIAIDNLSERIQEKAAKVIVSPLPTVIADETQMIQLFQNLIGNGLKFNKHAEPTIRVTTKDEHQYWRIAIADNGIGMRSSESHLLFAPFKRLHTQQEYEGTGIGLAICRRIVARHGGQIGLESELGKGSTFWFTLPKRTDTRIEADEPTPGPAGRKKGRPS